LSSCIPRYLSAATRLSIRVIILSSINPTSDATRISSKLSKTASSTLDFPATALLSLEKKVVLIFRVLCLKSLFF
jgi:aspartokinase